MRLRFRLPTWLILTLAYLFVIVSVALPAASIPLQLLARTTPVRNAEIPPEHHEIPHTHAQVDGSKLLNRRPRRVYRFETLSVQVLWDVAADQLRVPSAWERLQVHLPPRCDYLTSPLGLRAPPAA